MERCPDLEIKGFRKLDLIRYIGVLLNIPNIYSIVEIPCSVSRKWSDKLKKIFSISREPQSYIHLFNEYKYVL